MNFNYGCWPYLDMAILDQSNIRVPTVKRSDEAAYSESQTFDLKINEEEKEFLCSLCNRLLKMSNRMQATAYEGSQLSPQKLEELLKKIYESK